MEGGMEGALSSKETKEQKEETGPGMPPVGMDEATVNSDPVVISPRPTTRDFTRAEASTQHPSLGHSSSVGEVPQLVSPTWLMERLRLGLEFIQFTHVWNSSPGILLPSSHIILWAGMLAPGD